jgi:SAM-dependent methyltransferase
MHIPSIWLGRFHTVQEWQAARDELSAAQSVADIMDDRIIVSRHPFVTDAWCAVCKAVTPMKLDWSHVGTNGRGSVHPAWTETMLCPGCNLQSRSRALFAYLSEKLVLPGSARVYIAERVTPAYKAMKAEYADVKGSEYLGDGVASGEKRLFLKGNFMVRHEDLTSLSFQPSCFDLVVTQDCFEHIPDYQKSFSECRRVLAPGGSLVFTIPFFPTSSDTLVRAVVENGAVKHLLEPEYHGNPVGDGAALCFQHFGWDILGSLRQAGFAEASANLYWGPWQGHLGMFFFVFHARV